MDKIGITLLICTVFLVFNCKPTSNDNNKVLETKTTKGWVKNDYLSTEKKRLKRSLKRFPLPLNQIDLSPTISEMNALYAEGYQVEGHPIKAMAYLFKHQNQHSAAFKFIKSQIDEKEFNTMTSSNGGWFVVLISSATDAETVSVRNNLASVFAGEE